MRTFCRRESSKNEDEEDEETLLHDCEGNFNIDLNVHDVFDI
jgi:hypothetical protein